MNKDTWTHTKVVTHKRHFPQTGFSQEMLSDKEYFCLIFSCLRSQTSRYTAHLQTWALRNNLDFAGIILFGSILGNPWLQSE